MKKTTNKKYTIYHNKELNAYGDCTTDWFYRADLEHLRPVLFTEDINMLRTVRKKLNKELKKGC